MSQRSRHFSVAYAFSRLLYLLLPAATVMLPAPPVGAQSHLTLREGMRVKISTGAVKKAAGTVRSVTADSLYLFTEDNAAILGVAARDLVDLRVSRGRSVSAGAIHGGMWGGAIGASAALLIVPMALSDDPYDNSEKYLAAFVAQSIIGGMMWGGAIGAFVKRERWDAVSVKPVAVVSDRGIGFGFRIGGALLH